MNNKHKRKDYLLRALTHEGRQIFLRVSALSVAAVRRAALNDVRVLEIQSIQVAVSQDDSRCYPDWFLGGKA